MELFKKEIDALSHQISNSSIRPVPKKSNAYAEFPRLNMAKVAASFAGMVDYYRNYIKPELALTQYLSGYQPHTLFAQQGRG